MTAVKGLEATFAEEWQLNKKLGIDMFDKVMSLKVPIRQILPLSRVCAHMFARLAEFGCLMVLRVHRCSRSGREAKHK